MNDYLGYRVIVNGTTIPDRMIIRGSYRSTPLRREASPSWPDANGIDHDDVFEKPKYNVIFTLRKRTLEDQKSLIGAFELFENIEVTFWNDWTCSYDTGLFKMDRPDFVDFIENDEMWYERTEIHLTEY